MCISNGVIKINDFIIFPGCAKVNNKKYLIVIKFLNFYFFTLKEVKNCKKNDIC